MGESNNGVIKADPPRVHAVIFTWRNYWKNAEALALSLAGSCAVDVINSEPGLEKRFPRWHHLGPDAYYGAQWRKCREIFRGDILLQLQADITFDHFPALVERCRYAMTHLRCGVYAPNIDFTPHIFPLTSLKRVEGEIYEVPQTDCTLWAVSSDVLRGVPPIAPQRNRFGWGVDYTVLAVARTQGKRTLRDYAFTVSHPKSRGYSSRQALRDFRRLVRELPPALSREVEKIERERNLLLAPTPSRGWHRLARALRSIFIRFTERSGRT